MKATLVVFVLALTSALALPTIDVDKRIVGGENSEPHAAPYIITLQSQATGRHSCGGSILNVNWILTAAHCIPANNPLQIVAGQHDLTTTSGTEQLRLVAQSILHEGYDPNTLFNDIAVLRLETPLVLVPGIVEVTRLPPSGRIHSGMVTMHGWGSISRTEIPVIPDILQTVVKPIIATPLCQAIINAIWPDRPLFNEVCTGPLDGTITACFGDSGGPLVQLDEGGIIEQVGIAAWIGGSPCGQLNAPTVYVQVSAYLGWIAEHIA